MPYQSRLLRNSKQPLWVRAGLVSLWRFQDAANLGKDDRPAGNHATPVNAPAQGTGKVGGGVTLVAASTQSLSIPDNIAIRAGSGDFWLAVWIKANAPSGLSSIVSKSGSSVASGIEYQWVSFGSALRFRVSNGSSIFTATAADTLGGGGWILCLGWFNAATGRAYAITNNNASIGVSAAVSSVQSLTNILSIGKDAGSINPWDGDIDEVAFGKCAAGALGDGTAGTLANEISAKLYNGGLGRAFPWGPSSYAGVA